jgi:excisionase family DNA binding protein
MKQRGAGATLREQPLRSGGPQQLLYGGQQPDTSARSVAQILELPPLALAPLAAARLLSISKRSLSRLIATGKIVARKDGTRTLVDVESLKAYYANLPVKQ